MPPSERNSMKWIVNFVDCCNENIGYPAPAQTPVERNRFQVFCCLSSSILLYTRWKSQAAAHKFRKRLLNYESVLPFVLFVLKFAHTNIMSGLRLESETICLIKQTPYCRRMATQYWDTQQSIAACWRCLRQYLHTTPRPHASCVSEETRATKCRPLRLRKSPSKRK